MQKERKEKRRRGNRNVPPIHHDSTRAADNINPRAKKTKEEHPKKKVPKTEKETDKETDRQTSRIDQTGIPNRSEAAFRNEHTKKGI